ncbi:MULTISPECIES: gamma-glutamylcyclotransferase family protein [unclassified Pseudoalteromonas]|uniref:gamma-glutamylcyclotransferase family protein n=1 Tax=unclassified Pseudoalteromonas TaxID=194690 RepID=UPI000B3D11C5|nr:MULTISPECIES: gamma-glutamylcyclotransferase family protein [unclassified Pseudoalteromonas]MDN3378765.1 gamma-glutamylcyclotransferase [Pseudoalteromonas sp. APC 3893]MDN3387253.1 gamma-glutamylcyclotransferase [Pseudoalteromonas sp. APC 4017]OUS73793.1 UDP-N-acetylmuramate--alanine ligase [Pseudoalteromonas sp. A601]
MEKLFSYGTLQLEQVQLDTFGRLLEGQTDTLQGYVVGEVEITDAAVLKSSGQRFHPALIKTGLATDTVTGTIFIITEQELDNADNYEVDDYIRVEELFSTGSSAWVYVAKD